MRENKLTIINVTTTKTIAARTTDAYYRNNTENDVTNAQTHLDTVSVAVRVNEDGSRSNK